VKIDTRRLVSMTEANQNFSRVARLVNENGSAVILKNNHPRYLVLDFQKLDAELEQMIPAELLVEGGGRG
jgi:antitoxin Phd